MAISQLVDLNTLNAFYEQVKSQIEDRVAKTTYDKAESLGTRTFPYREAFIDDIHGTVDDARNLVDSNDTATKITASTKKGNLEKGASTSVAMWDSNEIRTLDAKDMPVSDDSYDMVFKENFKTQKSGSPLIVNDSIEYPLKDMTIFGKTEQKTTEGKNLFDVRDIEMAGGGISRIFKNNVYTAKCLADNGSLGFLWSKNYGIIDLADIPAGTYVFSAKIISGKRIENIIMILEQEDGSVVRFENGGSSHTIDSPSHIFTIECYNTVFNKGDEVSIVFQLEKGNTATSYEPYTGGKPSPSPEYPQEIVSAGASGSIETKVAGKNLLDINVSLKQGDDETKYIEMPINDGIKYTISIIEKAPTPTFAGWFGISEKPNTNNVDWLVSKGIIRNNIISFTNKRYLVFNSAAHTNMDIIKSRFDIQLEVGSEATAYEPFIGQTATASTPNGLTKWDRIEKRDGVWGVVGRTNKEKAIDLTWSAYSEHIFYANPKGNPIVGATIDDSYCNYLISQSNVGLDAGEYLLHPNFQYFYIYINNTVNTVEKLNTWLQSHSDMFFVYKSAEETFTPLPPEQQAQFEALHSNNPTTTVWNEDGTEYELAYLSKHGANLSSRTFNLETETESLGTRATDLELETESLGTRTDTLEATKIHYSYAVDASYEAL